jgi:hypothetical protein
MGACHEQFSVTSGDTWLDLSARRAPPGSADVDTCQGLPSGVSPKPGVHR